MKKVFRVLGVVLACIMCIFIIRQCNDQSIENNTPKVTVEDIKEALINAGYSQAHESGKEDVILDYDGTDYVSRGCLLDRSLPEFNFSKARDDIPKILDAVMPLYDKNFKQGDGKVVMKRLISARDTFLTHKSGDKTVFNGYKYVESLDETSEFTKCIMVGYNKE